MNLDKLFLKFGDDKSYVTETFLGIPLNIYTVITFGFPSMFFYKGSDIVTLVLVGIWYFFLSQFYWFTKCSNIVKAEKV